MQRKTIYGKFVKNGQLKKMSIWYNSQPSTETNNRLFVYFMDETSEYDNTTFNTNQAKVWVINAIKICYG